MPNSFAGDILDIWFVRNFIIKRFTIETFARSINASEKIVIDTDAGADDAVAILLTLKSECKGIKVLAITCSYGNTYMENVATNVLKILTVANRSDVSILNFLIIPHVTCAGISSRYLCTKEHGNHS